MKKCGKSCLICPYILEGKSVTGNNYTWEIKNQVNCNSYNLVYLIECNISKCKRPYIGETDRDLKSRICEHIGYIKTKKIDKATGSHFNYPGHSLSNMTVIILETIKNKNTQYRKQREKLLIKRFDTYYNGINLQP